MIECGHERVSSTSRRSPTLGEECQGEEDNKMWRQIVSEYFADSFLLSSFCPSPSCMNQKVASKRDEDTRWAIKLIIVNKCVEYAKIHRGWGNRVRGEMQYAHMYT